MSNIMKVFLLLAVIVCISEAQRDDMSGEQCLCRRFRNGINTRNSVKDIQIYPATIFCDKVEIVVTANSGLRYCLNPKLKTVQKLMASIMKPKTSTTARPTEVTSASGSTDTARF
ncbi:C-X-C motif chemokine 10-like [Sebastes umbrosus]|uniref:C-X-C motif chemokine 10-like n=1 Tax=Sebastes umbrosus TaxID=72105 RepID=UPI00189E1FCD|nr:C-X-C motif chemokine 10-like [Sebastes umbrosus]XP_037635606.1 C-X-C motif chemokine 10-like [Sebastes umbrosus]XP_037635607.1 C-X-C motif chemokine 10-like [Sebastes umbrosus]